MKREYFEFLQRKYYIFIINNVVHVWYTDVRCWNTKAETGKMWRAITCDRVKQIGVEFVLVWPVETFLDPSRKYRSHMPVSHCSAAGDTFGSGTSCQYLARRSALPPAARWTRFPDLSNMTSNEISIGIWFFRRIVNRKPKFAIQNLKFSQTMRGQQPPRRKKWIYHQETDGEPPLQLTDHQCRRSVDNITIII